MMRHRIDAPRVQPKSLFAWGNQTRSRDRVPAGEQCHFMSHLDEPLRQPGNDSFGTSIQAGRDALVKWRNLRDPHLFDSSETVPKIQKIRIENRNTIPVYP